MLCRSTSGSRAMPMSTGHRLPSLRKYSFSQGSANPLALSWETARTFV